MLRARHWIASRLYVLRIVSAAALAKTAHGAGTQSGRGEVRCPYTAGATRSILPHPTSKLSKAPLFRERTCRPQRRGVPQAPHIPRISTGTLRIHNIQR
ncbi:MAG: hypothetical protein LBM98_10970 [Oscillospiraceae bacterium]|nr:hypothetical protein [Oscillospiraceae bacterium]